MKYIAQNQDAQSKLRQALHEVYPDARKQSRLPTLEEILKTQHPYVDAFIEETLRLSGVLPLSMRQATVDTQILGYQIPKGTSVMFFGMGPGMTMPALSLDDKAMTEKLHAFRQKVGAFEEKSIAEFHPERWLKTAKGPDGKDEEVFNAHAGPAMAFGHGPRSCFGKRMAMAQIKIVLALVVWSFELLPLGPKLGGMDDTVNFTRVPNYVYLKLRKAM